MKQGAAHVAICEMWFTYVAKQFNVVDGRFSGVVERDTGDWCKVNDIGLLDLQVPGGTGYDNISQACQLFVVKVLVKVFHERVNISHGDLGLSWTQAGQGLARLADEGSQKQLVVQVIVMLIKE